MINNLTACPISGINGEYERIIISTLSIAVSSSIAALAAYYSARRTSEDTFKYNIELNKNKLRYQIYGELIGHKYLMSQLYVLYFLSEIQSQNSRRLIEYINYKIGLFKSNKLRELPKSNKELSRFFNAKKKLLENNKRTSIRSEELLIELAKSNELFWKTIGQIKILFDDDIIDVSIGKLEDFERNIEYFENNLKNKDINTINYQNLDENLDELESKWYEECELELKEHIDTYRNIIDELLFNLSKIIKIYESETT